MRLAAILLLAVFTQKMGGGLLVHNLLHTQTPKPFQQDDKSKEIRFACSCVDDFLMPFDEAGELHFPSPATETIVSFATLPSIVYTYGDFYFSRRGPPFVNC